MILPENKESHETKVIHRRADDRRGETEPILESFNGRFRDECLNVNWFSNLNDARRKVQRWWLDYNRARPHCSLNNRGPKMFRQSWEAVEEFFIKAD